MIAFISLAVSVLALSVSVLTAWLTLLRRGTVMMTQPTTIYFGPDRSSGVEDQLLPKVYLRTLLYSTAKRGRILESMFIRLRRSEGSQNFNIWVYGEGNLQRGSGLFVPESGMTSNHHFLLPNDGARFEFLPGHYGLEVFAILVGDRKKVKLLFSTELDVSTDSSRSLLTKGNGLYFDWGADAARYHAHVRPMPRTPLERVGRE